MSEVEIQNLIKSRYPSANHLKELNGGLVSQTYSFHANNGRYVFQVGNRLEVYEKERWVYNQFNHLLPLRNVIEISVENDITYSISNYIEGDKLFDLNSQELLDTCPSIMKTLELLETVDAPEENGYGRYDNTGQGAYPTWEDFIKAVFNENIYNWQTLEQNGLDSSVVKHALQELQKHINSVSLSKKNIIHGDLGSFNLIAKNGQITGIIDWSLSLYGDHLYDKANILFWNEDKLQPLIHRITEKYINSPETKEKIYCYILRIGLEEIYNTVVLNEIGYDIEWVANRLQKVINDFL